MSIFFARSLGLRSTFISAALIIPIVSGGLSLRDTFPVVLPDGSHVGA